MKEVDHEDVVLRTFILFVQTAQEVLKYADAQLYGKDRLSISRFVALAALASHGGVLKPSDIAEWTQTERHNVTTLIRRMRKEGLVTAYRNTKDKRAVDVTLTQTGRQALIQAIPVAQGVVEQVMLSITEGDAALLEKALRVLRHNAHYSAK